MALNLSYFKEALKEPINIAGLLVSGAAAAAAAVMGSWGWIEPTMILGGALVAEGFYLTVVPKTVFYRRRIEQKSRALIEASRRRQREDVIKTFDPREREAVDYLSWLKKQISDNYRKFARLQDAPPQLQELETTWEAFVDLLDEYRRRKNHLRTINRQAVENQLRQAERAAQMSDETTRPLHEKNVAILRRRLQTFDDIERSVKRVEAQLQMIENFFNLVNDQVVTMPTPEHISTLDFDTLLSSIEMTKEILQQTAPIMSQLDSLNREASQLRPSLATERR
jgi:vacuolar-type H+-ATPase subunit E/Vma4